MQIDEVTHVDDAVTDSGYGRQLPAQHHRDKFDRGVIRSDFTADDLRRLLGGIAYALRTGAEPRSRLPDYLAVLLAGLRP